MNFPDKDPKIAPSGKVIIGIIVFLALFTIPFYYNMGKSVVPTPEIPAQLKGQACVESVQFMKASHMKLLDQWRDAVVRDGKRVYKSGLNGKEYEMSLQNTCTKCHTNKEQFCDRCHNYVDVSPGCWDCHIAPPQTAQKQARKEQ